MNHHAPRSAVGVSFSATDDDAFLQAVVELGRIRPIATSQAICNAEGVRLVEAGVRVDADFHDRLRAQRLAVPLDASIDPGHSISAASLRTAADAALQRWPFFAQIAPPGRMRSMLLEAIAAVALPKPVALHLLVARETRAALFEHSVLMALLCAHLVREGGALLHDIATAATAGLLHDIGMLHIAPELLESGDPLNAEQLRPVYAHPLAASALIARFRDYPKEVVRAVLEHHERLDGSGYPRGLVGDAISPLGRLLSLAEVVTAMFDGRRQYPEQRVSLLLRMSPRRFDPALVPSIHRLLRAAPAPAGAETMVAAQSIDRLRRLGELVVQWRERVMPLRAALDPPRGALLQAVGEQTETLQRMLYEAGIAPGQLELLSNDAAGDPRLRVELWTLANELQWQLRSTANQLRRRWAAPGLAYPPALAAWLEGAEGLAREG